jgi:hypothetical protein
MDLNLQNLCCSSCGSLLRHVEGNSVATCIFCGNVTQVVRPVRVKFNSTDLSVNEIRHSNNYLSILEKSIIAGNFSEAYFYSNKCLEIDSRLAAFWENKAICSYWLRSNSELNELFFREIQTYLNMVIVTEPNSLTHKTTSRLISANLFNSVYYKYSMMVCDSSSNGKKLDTFSPIATMEIVNHIKLMDMCFEMYPTRTYLETAVVELTGLNKMLWIGLNSNYQRVNMDWCANYKIDAIGMRIEFIRKIKEVDPSYVEPDFPPVVKAESNLILWVIIGIMVLVIVWIMAFS